MRSWMVRVAVLASGAVGCANEMACPDGHRRVGNRCERLDQEGDPSTAADAAALEGGSDLDVGDTWPGEPDAQSPVADAGADASQAQLSCLVDLDGDGYGAPADAGCEEGLMSGDCADDDDTVHPGVSDSCADDIDRDCDGQPGTRESCNGDDDDCDGVADNGFACPRGATNVSCTTSCGTSGTGDCSEQCEIAVCTPPDESCNWQDDDCDGVADENVLERLTLDSYATHGESEGDGQVAMVKRKGGGAWVLTNRSTYPASAHPLSVRELDPSGRPVGNPRTLPLSDRVQIFAADSDGTSIALLGRIGATTTSDMSSVLVLMIYDALSLNVNATYELANYPDGGTTGYACARTYPAAVSIHTSSSGETYVAAGYFRTLDTHASPGPCSGTTDAIVSIYRVGHGLLHSYQKASLPNTRAYFNLLSLAKVPCREEWVAAWGIFGHRPIRLTLEASEELSELDFRSPVHASACDGENSWVVVKTGSGYARYRPDPMTGELSLTASRDGLRTVGTVLSVTGRWFAFGLEGTSPRGREFTWDSLVAPRDVPLAGDAPSVGPYDGDSAPPYAGLNLPTGLSGALALGDVVVTAFARSSKTSTFNGKVAAAITYRFGCN